MKLMTDSINKRNRSDEDRYFLTTQNSQRRDFH